MKKMLMCAALTAAGLAQGNGRVDVVSPDGRTRMIISTDSGVTYSLMRGNEVLIAPTAIGMTLEGKGRLGKTAADPTVEKFNVKHAFKTPIYKKEAINLAGNGARIMFDGGRHTLEVHAYNEGAAYRWVTDISGEITVIDETAGARIEGNPIAAVGYNNGSQKGDLLQNSWETQHVMMPVSEIDPKRLVYFPLMMQFKSGTALAMTESDVRDFAGLNLRRPEDQPGALVSLMAKIPGKAESDGRHRWILEREAFIVKTHGQRTFPWRIFMLADSIAPLMENDMVHALAAPADPAADFSWVKPGKVAWEWWNDWNITGVPFRAGCNTETYLHYIDFAARYGLEYVIMDEGWSVKLKIMEIEPSIDLQKIIDHGKAKNVGIILWCSWPQLVGNTEEVIAKYAEMGAKGFKVDFFDRDDAFVANTLENIAAVAARHKMLVDYHGIHKPTALHRKWPNILNYEGVYGLEQLKWANPDMVANDCTIAVSRMLAGPLDYTPGAMRNCVYGEFQPNYRLPRSQGTRMHQIALLVLYEGYIQMLCDSPSQYEKNPECTRFMASLPVVWSDTKAIAAEPRKNAVVARRSGSDWYVAGIVNWEKQDFTIPLAFLGSGAWTAEIWKDGVNADRDATDYAIETRTVSSGDSLGMTAQRGGGFVIRLSPAR